MPLLLVDVLKESVAVHLLAVLTVATLALLLERWFYFRRTRASVGPLLARVERCLAEGDPRAAWHEFAAHGSAPGRVGQAVLDATATSIEPRQAAREMIERESRAMERRVGILGLAGQLAPVLALGGAALGLYSATHESQASVPWLSAGALEAALSALLGVALAILATRGYRSFSQRIRVRRVQMEEVVRAVAGRPRPVTAARPPLSTRAA